MSVLTAYLSGFTQYLKVKNYSSASITAYAEHLPGLFVYLRSRGIGDVKRVTRQHLDAYQQAITLHTSSRTKRAYSIGTICTKTRAMKRFFRYLEESGVILINPAEQVKEPKKPRRLPRTILAEDEVRKILAQPKLDTINGIRARALLEVLYSTGIRLEELVNLSIFDCDLQGGLIRVKGKFSKDRVIPLGTHGVRFLKEYIMRIRPGLAKKNKTIKNLFISRRGEPMSKQVIELMVRMYAKKAGIDKRVTPHTFRHTFATELVKNGADISAVRKMLGHAHLSATNIYVHAACREVKNTHSKSHPRERDTEPEDAAIPAIRRIKEKQSHERL